MPLEWNKSEPLTEPQVKSDGHTNTRELTRQPMGQR